ncbi:DUF721 domain-containing protein [Pelagibacteraceae bacterium]|nr:DUF721 domain-containing protein [Pelagibacteraceae bacterium]
MHYKQNNKESKTYVQGLRPFGKTLPHGLKGILKKNGYNYSEIISKWSALVGIDISKCCYPKSIKMSKSGVRATLIISVKRGDEITVEYAKNEIINKINSYFGYQLIKEIRLEKFSKVEVIKKKNLNKFSKNFKNKIDMVENKEIRKSLSDLLKAIEK